MTTKLIAIDGLDVAEEDAVALAAQRMAYPCAECAPAWHLFDGVTLEDVEAALAGVTP